MHTAGLGARLVDSQNANCNNDHNSIVFRLFEIAPDLKDLFPFSKGTNHDEALKKHGLLVMESIDTAISLLGDGNFEELKDTLIELGIVHNMKEVQLDSFAVSQFFEPHSHEDFNSLLVAYLSIQIRLHLSWVESGFIQILCDQK